MGTCAGYNVHDKELNDESSVVTEYNPVIRPSSNVKLAGKRRAAAQALSVKVIPLEVTFFKECVFHMLKLSRYIYPGSYMWSI